MKKTFCLMFAALLCMTFISAAFADDDAAARRQAFIDGFEQLTKNTQEGLVKPAVKDEFTKDGSTSSFEKFNIAAVSVPAATPAVTVPCNLGIKVWFSLEDGTCFNPTKRKMGVKERFYVNIQSAVPVYVALFQNYQESRPESRQVYPDNRYPDTFKVIQAGVVTKLPVPFEMDDDTRDEIMSMVVVRADAPQIQTTLATQATSTVSTVNGTTTVTATATTQTIGTLKGFNDKASEVKFNIAAPAVTVAPVVQAPNDVAFYMFGMGYVGQWQLTLKK